MESCGSIKQDTLDKYPNMLTIDMCRDIAGSLFDDDLFHTLCYGESHISKYLFLSALDERTDVFLTHDWYIIYHYI